ncbi:hypothetical protein P153DRAFT_398795 [Dothidotthia symphoricarpi CBS 119687]|uniref:Heterokaryon incompatibility domain-containing protein n=1 Tax=Dothidotthia symphoricarpi CBS 119687 TaxID=1392245 RepID=A0A6A6A8G6_9PLEO|nr:uncharacterized protein P153DRAFT_398795 [Dothidotthia symphoricarpi CBS 119687]KAF2127463.1 hypothetical protein P153DRAFT_398795 [Dothidotthia symphoricarpi CBS 119687]
MAPYVYQPLDDVTEEIRLLTLHPGTPEEPIRISIAHVPFKPTEWPNPNHERMSLEELRSTLPDSWWVKSTLEGRYIFRSRDAYGYSITSYNHPDNDIARRYYCDANDCEEPKVGLCFEALSYTWGSVDGSLDIEVTQIISHTRNSLAERIRLPVSTLSVRRNLHDALTQLRHQRNSRILWIDALCINQNDLNERNLQVGRMRLIYKHASRVVVWLGPSDRGSIAALYALMYIGVQLEVLDSDRSIPAPNCAEKDWYRGRIPIKQEIWEAIVDLPLYSMPIADVYVQAVMAAVITSRRADILGFLPELSGVFVPSWVSGPSDHRGETEVLLASGSSATCATYVAPHELHISGIVCTTVEATSSDTFHDLSAAMTAARQCWSDTNATCSSGTQESISNIEMWTLTQGHLQNRSRSTSWPSLSDAKVILRGWNGKSIGSSITPDNNSWPDMLVGRLQEKGSSRPRMSR